MLVFQIAVFAASLAVLFWSADKMLSAAIGVSHHYKIPPIVIGTVVIGFGTSSPELAVSGLAAWENQTAIAIGNVFGSNVANLWLVLGLTALAAAVHADKKVLKHMFPLVLTATALPGVLMLDGMLSRIDGLILIAALIIVLGIVITKMDDQVETSEISAEKNVCSTIAWLLVGLILLLVSSEFAVRSAVTIAELLGISKLIIGLTVVALGTSLPEIATAVIGTRRRQHGIVVGNVLGSNIFNSLAVLGTAVFIRPAPVPEAALYRDFVVMIAATILLWALFGRQARLRRGSGLIILTCFIIYMVYLYVFAVE